MSKTKPLSCGQTVGTVVVAVCVSFAAAAVLVQVAWASAAPPSMIVTPQGNLRSGQTVSVEVGPNDYFTPNVGVKILECADPGGSAANLPKDDTTCDGNTIQGGTILVGTDGSFSDSSYTVYRLPSSSLGEPGDNEPVCDQAHYCVLYVGQDQNDFTKPKVFSAPFLVAVGSSATTDTTSEGGSGGSSGTTSTTAAPTTSSAGTPAAAGAGASGVTTSAGLADTGPPAGIGSVAALAMAFLLTGALGRRLVLRRAR